jgi:hypothetical protein
LFVYPGRRSLSAGTALSERIAVASAVYLTAELRLITSPTAEFSAH